jgi:putative toxin-antitoxin system antitoxin component (TIGR02293 family)
LKTVNTNHVISQAQKTSDDMSTSRTPDPNASDWALRRVSVTSQAIDVLGSQDAAEQWLCSPAMGLNGAKPIDLMQSAEGAEMVKILLTRMDCGVYA